MTGTVCTGTICAARQRRNRLDVIPNPPRLRFEKPTDILEQNLPSPQVSPKGSLREKPVEVPLEDHPVERADRSRN
jgi:hypothetical protein